MVAGLGYFLKGMSEGLPSAQQLEGFRYLREERKRKADELMTELEAKQRQAHLDAALQSVIQAGAPKEEIARRGFEAGRLTLPQLYEIIYPKVKPVTRINIADPVTGEDYTIPAGQYYTTPGQPGEKPPKESKPSYKLVSGKWYDINVPKDKAEYTQVYEEAEQKKAATTLEKDIRTEADRISKRLWDQEKIDRANLKGDKLKKRERTVTPETIHQKALFLARQQLAPETLPVIGGAPAMPQESQQIMPVFKDSIQITNYDEDFQQFETYKEFQKWLKTQRANFNFPPDYEKQARAYYGISE